MATKKHVTKSGDEWSWNETPEIKKYMEQNNADNTRGQSKSQKKG